MWTWLLPFPRRSLMALVRGYRLFLSPWLGNACRFEPTCSSYALEALENHGAAAGSYLTLRRLARCHPFCEGGHDPVPSRAPRPFQSFAAGPTSEADGASLTPTPEPHP